MDHIWYAYLGWIAAAALLGFAISFIFAGVLRLPRNIFLIPYIGVTLLFLYAYATWSELSIGEMLRHNWVWGLIGAVILAIFTIKNVRSQPSSPRSTGVGLAFDILWSGLLYGLTDALLLSVLPVLATWQALSLLDWTANAPGRILVALLATLGYLVTSNPLAAMFCHAAMHIAAVLHGSASVMQLPPHY